MTEANNAEDTIHSANFEQAIKFHSATRTPRNTGQYSGILGNRKLVIIAEGHQFNLEESNEVLKCDSHILGKIPEKDASATSK